MPFPLDTILEGIGDYDERILKPYNDLWNAAVTRVGRYIFHVEITVRPNGSGDTTYNYVQVFCYLMFATAAAAVWTLLDRKRFSYVRLYDWLRVYVRFYLATMMLVYGTIKVIPTQFPGPSLDRLVQPFGDASPMGLLWAFMGASRSYTLFVGAAEILGGLLLTTPRTTLLGSLICLGVLSNVVMLNFCYDVPVKLFSCHLLAMAAFLMAPDATRLTNFFLFNRSANPVELRPLVSRTTLRRAALTIRTVFVAGVAGLWLWHADTMRKSYSQLAPKPALYGVWKVEKFEGSRDVWPVLPPDASQWRRVIFNRSADSISIQLMDESVRRYALKLDSVAQKLNLTNHHDDPTGKAAFCYQQPEPDLLAMEGTFDGGKVRAQLRRANMPKFLLVNRGFHWINEYPFNY